MKTAINNLIKKIPQEILLDYMQEFAQALHEEKEQIVSAHGNKGWYKPEDKTSGFTTGEDYYNQMYLNHTPPCSAHAFETE
jgi:hypothetical protein